MSKNKSEWWQMLDDGPESAPRLRRSKARVNVRRAAQETSQEVAALSDAAEHFDFSYHATRHERTWIVDSLGGFYDGQWISDVLRQVKGGKEASVYQCAANPELTNSDYIAAKIYRPRMFRSLKNDHLYREGRAYLDEDGNRIVRAGDHHAMQVRSEYGLQLIHTSWIEHEYQALQILHAAGADVPQPYARGDNAILMAYIGDTQTPAPTLNSVRLDHDEARSLFKRVLRNVEIMLAHQQVHGDLSAYNILYWQGEITLIDFPQTIHPHENRNAYKIFERDITRVCEYFALQGVHSRPSKLAAEMWTAFRYQLAPEVHPELLDEESKDDRKYWQKIQDRERRA
jgi:RIO kinase 1